MVLIAHEGLLSGLVGLNLYILVLNYPRKNLIDNVHVRSDTSNFPRIIRNYCS